MGGGCTPCSACDRRTEDVQQACGVHSDTVCTARAEFPVLHDTENGGAPQACWEDYDCGAGRFCHRDADPEAPGACAADDDGQGMGAGNAACWFGGGAAHSGAEGAEWPPSLLTLPCVCM